MKVEYGDQTIGDDSTGDFIADLGGQHARLVQQTPLAGGTAQFLTPRGNHSNVRSFSINVEHETAAAAVAWFNDHPDSLPESGTLRITSGAYAAESAAVLQSVERSSLVGRSTQLTYVFICKQITQAA